MTETIIDIENLKFQWANDDNFGFFLPSLSINKEEKVLLLGESGSGKTTLLSLISGFISSRQGTITISNTKMEQLGATERDRFRADNIGIIFQQFNLLPYAKVIDNILLPLYFSKKRSSRVKDPIISAKKICNSLRLPERVNSMQAKNLSVGQQQRVAVARALIGSPPLIIADEPTSSLDMNARKMFIQLMFSQIKDSSSTLLMVSHDQSLSKYFDRVINIEDILRKEAQ